jgi:hypothetical protein
LSERVLTEFVLVDCRSLPKHGCMVLTKFLGRRGTERGDLHPTDFSTKQQMLDAIERFRVQQPEGAPSAA